MIGRGDPTTGNGCDARRFDRRWFAPVAVLAAVSVLLASCGGSGTSIQGSIQSRGTCASLYFLSGATPVDDLRITFRDPSGKVIGTAQSGLGVFDPPKPWSNNEVCTVSAPYQLELPKEDFYQAEVEGFDQQPSPVSYEELSGNSFVFNIDVSTG